MPHIDKTIERLRGIEDREISCDSRFKLLTRVLPKQFNKPIGCKLEAKKKGIQNTKIKHNKENNKTPTKAFELKLGVVGVVRTQCYHGGFRGGRSDDVLVSTVEITSI